MLALVALVMLDSKSNPNELRLLFSYKQVELMLIKQI